MFFAVVIYGFSQRLLCPLEERLVVLNKACLFVLCKYTAFGRTQVEIQERLFL